MIYTKRLINTFVNIAKIYSPTGSEQELADYLVLMLKDKADIVIKDDYGNVYIKLNGGGDSIFFAAHMDTVEPCKNVKPIVLNDKITSDGSTILGADNKVTIASIIELLTIIKEKKISHKTLEIIFTKSEEVGNYGAINFDYSLLSSKTGYCFDSISPIGTIISASPFYEAVDITLIGKQLHASIARNNQNLIKITPEFVQLMNLGRVDDETLVNIGIIQTGYARNTVPGDVNMKGEIRSFVYKNITREKNSINKLLKNLSIKYGMKYKTSFVKENEGYIHANKPASYLIKKTKKSLQNLDIVPNEIKSWAVSDANIFNKKNLTCLNLGDGVVNAHSNQESITIFELNSLTQVMLKLVGQ